jgi:hypothetical protein
MKMSAFYSTKSFISIFTEARYLSVFWARWIQLSFTYLNLFMIILPMVKAHTKFEGNFWQIKVCIYRGCLTNNVICQDTVSNWSSMSKWHDYQKPSCIMYVYVCKCVCMHASVYTYCPGIRVFNQNFGRVCHAVGYARRETKIRHKFGWITATWMQRRHVISFMRRISFVRMTRN